MEIQDENHDQINPDPQYPESERGGLLFNGKTAQEWFKLHEIMRLDFRRVLQEKEEIR